ncbi:MAG TPA: hypothetical protein PK857_06905, partial [Hyphomicrobium sp.]|nr:hypothetical protein [Hyphomicrobium sp.]
ATGAAGAATGAAGAAAGAAGAAGAAQEAAEAAQMAAEAAAASSLLLDGSRPMTGPIVLSEISAPDAPAAGRMALYTKSNQKLYYKDAAGAEVEIGGGTSDRLTPAMFGAAGDGIADDSEAIANALGVAVSAGLPLDLGGADKTYLLDDWEAWGHEPAGPIKIASQGALVKGPAGGAYFLRPGTVFEISNTRFDRWTGVVDARSADEGEISGARFEGNACTNISGIPFNVECEFRDGHVGRNRFANCTGGYIIRIGDNDYARQNEWSGNIIEQNIIRSVTASGETSLFAIIVYGRDTLILGNDLRDLASTNGECIGIYTKLRNSRVIGNSVRNLSSSGGSGAALDVVGISMKGARRNVTNSGPQGYDMTCIGNTVIGVGAQNVKGTGIRAQISDAIVANNIINDVGLIGVNVDDSNGSVSVGVCDNHIRGFNMLGVTGIMVSTYGSGHRVTGNSVIDFQRCVRVEGISPNSVAGVKVTGNHLKFLNNGASIYIGDFVGSLTMFGNSHEGTGNQAVLWSGTPAKAIQQQEDFTMCTVTNVNGGTPTNPLTGGSNLVP